MADVIDTTARDVDDDGGFDEVAQRPSLELARPEPTPAEQAVVDAAAAAMAMPGVPGRDEFLMLAAQARMLHMSGAAPPIVRESVYIAFHVAMIGRDLGLSPSAALELVDVISTSKGPRISLSPQLLNGQIRRLGMGEIVPVERTERTCTAIAIGPGGRDRRCRVRWPAHVDDCTCDVLGSSTFDWEDARIAGLVAEGCEPGANTAKCQNRNTHPSQRCNQGYITYPKRMLWWRASGFCADDFFPEAGMGLYSPEELGAVVDVDGRPIDPATVELPAGYEPAAIGSSSSSDDPADPDELWTLQLRLHALPAAQQEAWREQKRQQDRLKGVPTYMLSAPGLRLARSLVSGLESAAKKADPSWDATQAQSMVEHQVWANVIRFVCGDAPDDRPAVVDEPAAPDPGPADAVDEAEAALERAKASADAIDNPPADTAGPTGADVDELRANLEQTVKGMTVGQVRMDLVEYGLPVDGGAAACRKRLVGHLLTEELKESAT